MLSTSSFATSPSSSLSSSSSSAAVSRFVPNPRGHLCHRQERTMSINIYNKHAQKERERETDWKKDRFPRNQNKTQTHSQTRLPLLKTRYHRLRKSPPHLPPLSASTSSFIRGEKERERDREGERVNQSLSLSLSLILFKFVSPNNF